MTIKLISDIEGSRWALKDNRMIFCNVVWLLSKEDRLNYHLLDREGKEIVKSTDNEAYMVLEP